MSTLPSQLRVPDLQDQQRHFKRAFSLLEQAIARRAFPGAVLAVTSRGELRAHAAFGRQTFETGSPAVTAETPYDLASLTKPIATTAMAMLLYQRHQLDLEMPVATLVPEFGGGDKRAQPVTVGMLLAHSSGLPGYARLYEKASSAADLLRSALGLRLVAEPGTAVEYSDIGFIVLGELLHRISGQTLDSFCRHEIFWHLGMSATTFAPPSAARHLVPPTEHNEPFRKRRIQGEVHDTNAFALGGVAGHAGLFAPVADVVRFALCMLQGGTPIFKPATIALFTARASKPRGSTRTLGWDTPSLPSQSGRYFSQSSFGHLGYTGTSLWIDPLRQVSITLLTNRTWPDNTNELIKEVRPAVHDAIMEALEQS